MDASYLSHQVNTIVEQLHSLFDEIGVPNHEREARETELFASLSDTLNNHIRQVNSEKKKLIEEAQHTITIIRQMEASLDDSRCHNRSNEDDSLRVTYPLMRCLKLLREKHQQVRRLYEDRLKQVRKLIDALESYSSHLEPTFVSITLPPSGPNAQVPPTFDVSPTYIDKLDQEFTRVYDEYTRRIQTVQSVCEQIIDLWAELGISQSQTDANIVKYYRDAPEQLGLHQEDIYRLMARHEKLVNEKNTREKHLAELKTSVENMWAMLGVDETERKTFLNANRGCGIRQINEFEDEAARLSELKRQNLHIFVEDVRCKIQELWDALYFSEDEMLEFTPAFSDVYSDALLEAHEREMARLERLREQRAPTLTLIEKYKDLTSQKQELAQSSQDASRLMMRGQKGERRDPGKLLREEKMRKRIAKELPKVVVELRKILEKYEEEYGVPFTVQGERYLNVVEEEEAVSAPGSKKSGSARPKTPGGSVIPTNTGNLSTTKSVSKTRSMGNIKATASQQPQPLNRNLNRSPVAGQKAVPPLRPASTVSGSVGKSGASSPTRPPARTPLSGMPKNGSTSPIRGTSPMRGASPTRAEISGCLSPSRQPSRMEFRTLRHGGTPLMRAPPPKMREPPKLETPANPYKGTNLNEGSMAQSVTADDVFGPNSTSMSVASQFAASRFNQPSINNMTIIQQVSNSNSTYTSSSSTGSSQPESFLGMSGLRQVSGASTYISGGSENWETYDDGNSDPEPDASDMYFAKLQAARGKRYAEDALLSQNRSMMGPETDGIPGQVMHMEHHGRTYSRSSRPSNGSLGYSSSGNKRMRGVSPLVGVPPVVMDQEGNRVGSGSEWTDDDIF